MSSEYAGSEADQAIVGTRCSPVQPGATPTATARSARCYGPVVREVIAGEHRRQARHARLGIRDRRNAVTIAAGISSC